VRAGVRLVPRLHLEAEAFFLFTETASHSADVKVLAWRGQLLFDFVEDAPIRPFALAGFGALTVLDSSTKAPEAIGADTDPAVPAGAGFKLDLNDWLGLRAEGRILLPPAVRSTGVTVDWEVLAGFFGKVGGVQRAGSPPRPAPKAPPPVPPPPAPPRDTDGDG